jgi:hypothetical protein
LSAFSDIETVSQVDTGRYWMMVFSRWTEPIAGKGNDASAISADCRGNTSRCR